MRPGWNLQSKIEHKSVQKFVVGKIFYVFVQSLYLIKNTIQIVILSNIINFKYKKF